MSSIALGAALEVALLAQPFRATVRGSNVVLLLALRRLAAALAEEESARPVPLLFRLVATTAARP